MTNRSLRGERCALQSRRDGVDPIGTAGSYDVFVLVEHPLPWPSEITDDPLVAQVAAAAQSAAGPDRRVRVQGLVPRGENPRGSRRVIVYARPDGAFIRYGRAESAATPTQLDVVAAELVAPARAEALAADIAVADVLVCTHGSRDGCCGSMGMRLFANEMCSSEGVRLWRTSHTGGHRFAPTAITFPSGHYWAYLDADLLTLIIDQSVAPSDLAPHYRGCAAFGSKEAQAAERAAFATHGWAWTQWRRWVDELGDGHVRVGFERPDGETAACHAVVETSRVLPVPACGLPPSAATKTDREVRVVRFSPVIPRGVPDT